MSDTATASAAIPPLSITHIVHLPGALGGLELHSSANVHLADRKLFDAIAECYGALIKHHEGSRDLGPFDSFEMTIEDQRVDVFFSGASRSTVNTTVRVAA